MNQHRVFQKSHNEPTELMNVGFHSETGFLRWCIRMAAMALLIVPLNGCSFIEWLNTPPTPAERAAMGLDASSAPAIECPDVDLMGVTVNSGEPALGGLNIYAATLRNKGTYTKQVTLSYDLADGTPKTGNWNVGAGQMIEARLDVSTARAPLNVRITGCR
jgi:hypothetical protein